MAVPLNADATMRPTTGQQSGARSRYRTFLPTDPATAVAIACTWEGHAGWARPLRLLPDGCVDLVWDGAALIAWAPRPVAWRGALQADNRNVGVRLTCGAGGAVLGLPVDRLGPSALRLRDIWGTLARDTETCLARTPAPDAQRARLERLVADRLNDGHRPDASIIAAARRLAAPAAITVAMVAQASGLGTRELHRRFRRHVGYGPKVLQRIFRFSHVIRSLPAVADGRLTLTSLAADLGYADQAHLSRDCKQITGSTPGALLRSWRH